MCGLLVGECDPGWVVCCVYLSSWCLIEVKEVEPVVLGFVDNNRLRPSVFQLSCYLG